MVSTSTFAGPSRPGPVICRVASTPSIRGIRMSISTTSGCSARTWSMRLQAVPGLADDREVLLGLQDHPETGTQQRLVVDQQDADGHGSLLR